MQKRWLYLRADEQKVKRLKEELNIHPALLNILVQRGIYTYDDANNFFNPNLNTLHDPFLMKDMHTAVARINLAINRNEKILIYGDYDVDGTTAVALLYQFLVAIYPNIDCYIPNRYTEGYGISIKGIDFAAENNFTLIIALDCGIKSADKVTYASQKGIEFIICDHHLPGDDVPLATAVLDPKQTSCSYPYKELSGCGIGFKLAQAFCITNGYSLDRCFAYLDLVCVSIASDIVPITGENRVLAFHGLKKLNSENALPGLKSLIQVAGTKKFLDITDVVFLLGPRINAAGRIKDAKHAVKLLIGAEHDDDIWENADTLHSLNDTRKQLDKQITAEALAMIEADVVLQKRKTTVVFNPAWNKGVIGIVASRLIETYYRPTIVMTESDGKLTGSARSVKHFDLHEAISACSEHLLQFGGHKFAAGLTMEKEKLEKFSMAFEHEVSMRITDEQLVPEIEIDATLELNDITERFYNTIQRMAPFGPENMKPVFVLKGMKDSGYSRVLKETHLRVSLKAPDSRFLSGIGFNMADKYSLVNSHLFDIAFTLDMNTYEGRDELQLMVKDIKPSA